MYAPRKQSNNRSSHNAVHLFVYEGQLCVRKYDVLDYLGHHRTRQLKYLDEKQPPSYPKRKHLLTCAENIATLKMTEPRMPTRTSHAVVYAVDLAKEFISRLVGASQHFESLLTPPPISLSSESGDVSRESSLADLDVPAPVAYKPRLRIVDPSVLDTYERRDCSDMIGTSFVKRNLKPLQSALEVHSTLDVQHVTSCLRKLHNSVVSGSTRDEVAPEEEVTKNPNVENSNKSNWEAILSLNPSPCQNSLSHDLESYCNEYQVFEPVRDDYYLPETSQYVVVSNSMVSGDCFHDIDVLRKSFGYETEGTHQDSMPPIILDMIRPDDFVYVPTDRFQIEIVGKGFTKDCACWALEVTPHGDVHLPVETEMISDSLLSCLMPASIEVKRVTIYAYDQYRISSGMDFFYVSQISPNDILAPDYQINTRADTNNQNLQDSKTPPETLSQHPSMPVEYLDESYPFGGGDITGYPEFFENDQHTAMENIPASVAISPDSEHGFDRIDLNGMLHWQDGALRIMKNVYAWAMDEDAKRKETNLDQQNPLKPQTGQGQGDSLNVQARKLLSNKNCHLLASKIYPSAFLCFFRGISLSFSGNEEQVFEKIADYHRVKNFLSCKAKPLTSTAS